MENLMAASVKIKEVFKQAIIEVMEEKKDLIQDLIIEAMEDLGMIRAIQQGEDTETIDRDEVFHILKENV
jgi:hypothetical protein